MIINVAPSDLPDFPDLVKAHFTDYPDQPLRVRVQPQVYFRSHQAYRGWAGATWQIELGEAAGATRLHQTLKLFFQALGDIEEAGDWDVLDGLLREFTQMEKTGKAGEAKD